MDDGCFIYLVYLFQQEIGKSYISNRLVGDFSDLDSCMKFMSELKHNGECLSWELNFQHRRDLDNRIIATLHPTNGDGSIAFNIKRKNLFN